MIHKFSTKHRSVYTVRWFPLVLLLIYFSGTSHLEVLHSFYHNHDQRVKHSEEQEKNPCHRSIYHFDFDELAKNCGHNAHLVVADKCTLCDHNVHQDHLLFDLTRISSNDFSSPEFISLSVDADSYSLLNVLARGPPDLS